VKACPYYLRERQSSFMQTMILVAITSCGYVKIEATVFDSIEAVSTVIG